MKVRDQFKLLLVCLSTLWSHVVSVAPGDLPSGCPASVATNERALIDSCCYDPLLSPNTWIAVDSDSDGETWTSAMSTDANCAQNVMICNSTDDWLVTQYINTTLESGMRATQLPVEISCTGNCSSLELWIYQTNDASIDRTIVDLATTFMMLGSVSSVSTLNALTMDGFYLAVRAQSGACATINQLSIIATMCNEETITMVTYPTSYESSIPVSGSCLADSEPSIGVALTAMCGSDGQWTTTASCVCSAGHTLNNDVCVDCSEGTYKDTAGNEACSDCPANSVAMVAGATMCECEASHTRPMSNRPSDGCTECISNFFVAGGRCGMCPMNSVSSGGTATSCACIDNHTTLSGNPTTTTDVCVCQANYHENGDGQCVECPRNSERAIDADPSSCMCSGNYSTPSGDAMTSGAVGCTGCVNGYFLDAAMMCMMCPHNSGSTSPTSTDCTCSGNTVTTRESDTTTIDSCSSCPANWRSSSMSPLVCMPCPVRSERPFGGQQDNCTCLSGYEFGVGINFEVCVVRVNIPPSPLTLSEGSATDPASFELTLTADSFSDLDVVITVDDAYRSRVSPNTNVMFRAGQRQASITISGNDEALDEDLTFEIEVVANDAYAGSGPFQITLEDDDVVGVGFLSSQPVVFNESDHRASIMLNKNATTVREIQVNVVMPEGSSVSVSNPVTLPRGSPMNVTVQLIITNDVRGSEMDEHVSLSLELVSPMEFSHLINLDVADEGVSDQLTIIIKDDDPPPAAMVLSLYAIIGIAIGGAAVLVLLVLIVLVCVCICRFNANRRGFYFTDEDKTAAPPSMLRYSASLRSISSQSVVPIVGGKGQVAEKENEFYV